VTEDRFVDPYEELQGPYVLGELSAEEERELERHLEGCSPCRSRLDRLRQTHALLRGASSVAPPTGVKGRVLSQVRGETLDRSTGSIGGWKLWVATAASLLVAAVIGVELYQSTIEDTSTSVPLTTTALAPGAGGEVRGEVVGENLHVELEVWGLPELHEDEYYEMWYYAEGDGRISCGTFRTGPGGRATVDLTAPASAKHYPDIEITREPDDGDPDTSGEEILVGSFESSEHLASGRFGPGTA
jgi:anti-sigma-K factor RskA